MSRGGERRLEFENAGHRKRPNSIHAPLYGACGNLVFRHCSCRSDPRGKERLGMYSIGPAGRRKWH
jgi:hypothetical protein